MKTLVRISAATVVTLLAIVILAAGPTPATLFSGIHLASGSQSPNTEAAPVIDPNGVAAPNEILDFLLEASALDLS